jgi:L-cysteine:1D-myo-inositol 2-amino-2-deoxy-alpha-D-glucopyranoside ligase
MRLYNSFTATKEEFLLPTDRPVTMYVCGVTPYDTTHVGHARTYLTFDILLRYLRWQGAEVRYCQNVTDVDDPLFERAERDGVDWRDLAHHQTEQYLTDTKALNILPPTYFPRASEEIEGMHFMIDHLIRLGHAYVREGNVYFSIKTDPEFGKMSRLGYDEMLNTANQSGNKPDDPHKQDPLDFVLWQRGKPGDPTWDSPWGPGRPGWHIECSTMATRYLGPQIDIHGGGADLVFPHHACEIAQTEPVTGLHPFAKCWMHAGLVWLDGEKMSKSRGNLVFVRDALKEHDSNSLRWYLLTKHYRDEFHYQRDEVAHKAADVAHMREALHASGGTSTPLDVARARQAFDDALGDDLHTAQALAVLSDTAAQIRAAATEQRDVSTAQAILAELAGVLGIRNG